MSKETENTKETVVKTASAKSTKDKATTTNTVVYIGPTIPGVVTGNRIFSNGINKELKEEVDKMPTIGNLIVPISGLAKARNQLSKKDTPMNICYEKVQQYLKEKGE